MADGLPPEKREMSPEWWAQNAIEAARRETAQRCLDKSWDVDEFELRQWLVDEFGLDWPDERFGPEGGDG